MYSMLCIPFSDPAACVRQGETYASRKHVTGFMVTTVRHLQVNDNAYMRLYGMLEERGLALAFRSRPNWNEPGFRACNPFLPVHALGSTFHHLLHSPNWGRKAITRR